MVNVTTTRVTNTVELNFKVLSLHHQPGLPQAQHTKREELLFLNVLALPKASNNGLEYMMMSLTYMMSVELPETAAMYFMINLAASVFPAPDSPLHCHTTVKTPYVMIMHWFSRKFFMSLQASCVTLVQIRRRTPYLC